MIKYFRLLNRYQLFRKLIKFRIISSVEFCSILIGITISILTAFIEPHFQMKYDKIPAMELYIPIFKGAHQILNQSGYSIATLKAKFRNYRCYSTLLRFPKQLNCNCFYLSITKLTHVLEQSEK